MKSITCFVILLFGIPETVGTCTDSTSVSQFTVGEDGEIFYKCRTLVKAWPILCDPAVLNNVAEICCQSCMGVDYDCQDEPITITGEGWKMNCAELVKSDQVGLCLTKSASDVQKKCCRSCRRADLRCLDNPAAVFPGDRTCRQMADDLGCSFCRNVNYREICCASCKKFTKEHCKTAGECKDDPMWSYATPNGVIHCSDVKDDYACLCSGNIRQQCCESCKNVDLNKCRDCPIWKETIRGKEYSDCSVVEKFPFLCTYDFFGNAKKRGGGFCCETCAKLKKEMKCADDPMKTFTVGGKHLYCEELVAANPCFCEIREVIDNCCGSCKGQDLSMCGCKDRIKRANALKVFDRKVMSCKALLNIEHGYPYFCKLEKIYKPGGMCCDSCKNVDTTCVDMPLMVAPYIGGRKRPCKDLIRRFPYFCKKTSKESQQNGFKDRCCHSCKGVDTTCVDEPVFIQPKASHPPMTCMQLAKVFPFFCKPDQFKDRCCHSCSNVDASCTDNPYWSATIETKNAGNCIDCTCEQLKKAKHMIRKTACCDKAADECCYACRNVKCSSRK